MHIKYSWFNNLVEAHCYGIGRTGQIVEQSHSSEKQIECRRFDHEGLRQLQWIVTDEDLRHCYVIAQQFVQSYSWFA